MWPLTKLRATTTKQSRKMEKYWILVFFATCWAFQLISIADCKYAYISLENSYLIWNVCITGAVSSGAPGSTNCNPNGLTCCKHEYVRCEKTGCDKNTCALALASGPRACAQYIAKVAPYCDCVAKYFRDSAGNCVTEAQCRMESAQGGSKSQG